MIHISLLSTLVLQWFDNPYFIQQNPNLEALQNVDDDEDINDIIEDTKENLGISINIQVRFKKMGHF